MNEQEQQAALAEFWNSTAPMSQVRERSGLPNGWFDFFVTKLDPKLDDNGLIYIERQLTVTAPVETKDRRHTDRLYIGTHKDPQAKLPETRLNSSGYSTLKTMGRVTDVPCGDDIPNAQLCGSLLNKSFTGRIETQKDKKDPTKEYTNLVRTVKLGAVPARIDGSAVEAGTSANGAAAPVSPEVAGATFGTE